MQRGALQAHLKVMELAPLCAVGEVIVFLGTYIGESYYHTKQKDEFAGESVERAIDHTALVMCWTQPPYCNIAH